MTDFSDDHDESDAESNYAEDFTIEVQYNKSDCLIDSGTTHAILKDKHFFTAVDVRDRPSSIKTLGGTCEIAEGSGEADLVLPNGTVIRVDNAIYAPRASRNLLGFADLRKNGFHLMTATDVNGSECLQLRKPDGKTCEVFGVSRTGLYTTEIQPAAGSKACYVVSLLNAQP